MSIKKYTNFEEVDLKKQNEGQYLQAEDFFIVTKNEVEETNFGECKYDVMEVAVYDINNNLLPHKSGNNVAYIKSQNIAQYMYNVTNQQGQKELAINAEKLLNDLGFTNGILKLNINFVRNRIGSDNELERVWIQEISPTREEIRILPLKTKFENINQKTSKEFDDIINLTKDFVFYKREMINVLDLYQTQYLEKIDATLQTKFGKDFFNILKKDFGLSKFADMRTKIFSDFRTSVTHYLENRYYTLGDSNYGRPSEIRFNDCDRYTFATILGDIENILSNCVEFNLSFLKRRGVDIQIKRREFSKVELQKTIKDTLNSFNPLIKDIKVVYDGEKVIIPPPPPKDPIKILVPDVIVTPDPIVKDNPIDSPPKEEPKPEPKPIPKDIKVEPIEIIDMPPPPMEWIPIDDVPPPPRETIEPIGGDIINPKGDGVILNTGGGISFTGGGSGGGNIDPIRYTDFGTGLPRDFVGPREQQNME